MKTPVIVVFSDVSQCCFMNFATVCVLLHLAVTLFLTGLIWVIQLVHYPLMAYVQDDQFIDFEKEHSRRIGTIVAPTMILEGVLIVALFFFAGSQFQLGLCIAGFILGLLIWLSTFLIQVPIHQQLALGRSATAIAKLVLTNWIRTGAWSLRSLIALAYCLSSDRLAGALP